jgi:mercuric ion binding protein
MIRPVAAAVALALTLSTWAARAAERTVVLNVDNATCNLCAPIVQSALSRVSGVKAVNVKEADAMSGAVAAVTFDDAIASVAMLIAATTKAGYPSRLSN